MKVGVDLFYRDLQLDILVMSLLMLSVVRVMVNHCKQMQAVGLQVLLHSTLYRVPSKEDKINNTHMKDSGQPSQAETIFYPAKF